MSLKRLDASSTQFFLIFMAIDSKTCRTPWNLPMTRFTPILACVSHNIRRSTSATVHQSGSRFSTASTIMPSSVSDFSGANHVWFWWVSTFLIHKHYSLFRFLSQPKNQCRKRLIPLNCGERISIQPFTSPFITWLRFQCNCELICLIQSCSFCFMKTVSLTEKSTKSSYLKYGYEWKEKMLKEIHHEMYPSLKLNHL